MSYSINPITTSDLPALLALWKATEGIGLNDADTLECLARFLLRNQAMSFGAYSDNHSCIGGVLCGHDGRRGYLHHLAVDSRFRNLGIGRALIDATMRALAREKVHKCSIFVLENNSLGQTFWKQIGWETRNDISIMQKEILS